MKKPVRHGEFFDWKTHDTDVKLWVIGGWVVLLVLVIVLVLTGVF